MAAILLIGVFIAQNYEIVSGDTQSSSELLLGINTANLNEVQTELTALDINVLNTIELSDRTILKVGVNNKGNKGNTDTISKLHSIAGVEYVESNEPLQVKLFAKPVDPLYDEPDDNPDQWYFHKIGMEAAWDIEKGDSNVLIAVLDTGINKDCNQFKDKYIQGIDLVNNDYDAEDDVGHGSRVSSLLIAKPDNNLIAGMLWEQTRIIPVKIIGPDKKLPPDRLADGIKWAAKEIVITREKDCVISMSFGLDANKQVVADAIAYAHELGCLLVAASGNDGDETTHYPCGYDEQVLCVGGTTDTDGRYASSNYGIHLDIMAPIAKKYMGSSTYKSNLLINKPNSNDDCPTIVTTPGTSEAAPQVAGVGALIFAKYKLDPRPSIEKRDRIEAILVETAKDLYTEGWDEETGWGRLDAKKALESTLMGGIFCGDSICTRPIEDNQNCNVDCAYDSDGINIYNTGYCTKAGTSNDDACIAGSTHMLTEYVHSHDVSLISSNLNEHCEEREIRCSLSDNQNSCNDGRCLNPNDPSGGSEDTAEKCSDEIDNDFDNLIDFSDPDCIDYVDPYTPYGGSENNADNCNNGQDDDGDFLTDMMDPDCVGLYTEEYACIPIRIGRRVPSNHPILIFICPPTGTDECSGYEKRLDMITGQEYIGQCALAVDSGNPSCTECNEECGRSEPGDGNDDWNTNLPPEVVDVLCGGDSGSGS